MTSPAPSISPLGVALSYVYRSWKGVAVVVALTMLSSAIAMVGPALVAAALSALRVGGDAAASGATFDLNSLGDHVLSMWPFRLFTDPSTLVVVIGLAYLAQALAAAVIQYSTAVVSVRVRTNVLHHLQIDLMKHLLRQSLRFFNHSRVGELVSRLIGDAQNTSAGVGPAVQGLFQSSIQIVGYSLYLFGTSRWLTLGALGVVGLHFSLNRLLRDPVKRASRSVQNAQAQLSATFHEVLSAVRVVKSFGAESMALARTRVDTEQFRRISRAAARVENVSEPARSALDALAVMAVLIVAALEVRAGRLTPQGLVLYVYVARVVIQPANGLASSYLRLVGVAAALTRIADLLNQVPNVTDGSIEKRSFERGVRFDRVAFAYDDRPVLSDVTLDIARGEVVAVVGRSGSGKSTLTDLLLRLYDPVEGRILVDGVDIRELKQVAYRQLFGVVSQDTLLLNDTVRNNIRFGRDQIDDARIVEAARLAHAEPFIERLSLGYDTLVGDRGVRLSGGERQRVAIARAIAHEPQILILDEATSALDSESEREVQLAVDGILQTTTAIIVAHRLSTILHADKIVFLDDGRIVDVGRHQELLERCGPYRRLCELQFLDRAPAAEESSR